MTDMKTCTKCGQVKPADDFPRRSPKSHADGRCQECVRAYSRAWYERNALSKQDTGELTLACKHCDQEFTYVKTTGPRRQFCSERCKANAAEEQRMNRKAHAVRRCACGSPKVANVGTPVCADCRKDKRDPEKQQLQNRRRRLALYGITQAELDELLASQRGHCPICETEDPGPRGWFVDHDHACCPGIGSCGRCIRGLLCHDCNLLLGHAKDRTDTLERAKRYLAGNSQLPLKLQVVKSNA